MERVPLALGANFTQAEETGQDRRLLPAGSQLCGELYGDEGVGVLPR